MATTPNALSGRELRDLHRRMGELLADLEVASPRVDDPAVKSALGFVRGDLHAAARRLDKLAKVLGRA